MGFCPVRSMFDLLSIFSKSNVQTYKICCRPLTVNTYNICMQKCTEIIIK